MSEPLYLWSRDEAEHLQELDQWQRSYAQNVSCARAIETAISEHYVDNSLKDCAAEVIQAYGYDRVNWVLANTIRRMNHDGRFSQENKHWANAQYIPNEVHTRDYAVRSHPGLANLFTNQVREAWQALNLFDAKHCAPNEQDYTGRVVVLKPGTLLDEYKSPEYQLFLATGGFGCNPEKVGRKVFGEFLKDGESTHFYREDFLGVLLDEHLPDWARERLAELQPEPTEDVGVSMGGM